MRQIDVKKMNLWNAASKSLIMAESLESIKGSIESIKDLLYKSKSAAENLSKSITEDPISLEDRLGCVHLNEAIVKICALNYNEQLDDMIDEITSAIDSSVDASDIIVEEYERTYGDLEDPEFFIDNEPLFDNEDESDDDLEDEDDSDDSDDQDDDDDDFFYDDEDEDDEESKLYSGELHPYTYEDDLDQ